MRATHVLIGLFAYGILLVSPVDAQMVAPGETLVFTQADDGERLCRVSVLPPLKDQPGTSATCLLPHFGVFLTDFDGSDVVSPLPPEKNQVKVFASAFLLTPQYATALVYSEFFLEGSGNVVDAQISVTYDYTSTLTIVGPGKVGTNLSLIVKDISDPANPVAIGAATLIEQERTNTQGITDVTAGIDSSVLLGENAHLIVKLRTGRDYRIEYKLDAVADLDGNTVATAKWTDLRVTVQKSVTAELDKLRKANCEIIRLLVTPHGQRSSNLDLCSDHGGFPFDFPENDSGTGNGNGNGNGNANGQANRSGGGAIDPLLLLILLIVGAAAVRNLRARQADTTSDGEHQ